MAEIIGLNNTKELMKKFKGYCINFPSRVSARYVKKYIAENYDGTNRGRQLIQRKLGISRGTFYKYFDEKIILNPQSPHQQN